MTKHELLDLFVDKARCMHSQQAAYAHWNRLKPHLTTDQRNLLSSAWGHHTFVGEGPGDLEWNRKEIHEQWRRDV